MQNFKSAKVLQQSLILNHVADIIYNSHIHDSRRQTLLGGGIG